MAFNAARINEHLTRLVSNGAIEVGLEVGSDPGLPLAEHIRIPKIMRVGYTAHTVANQADGAATVVDGQLTAKKGKGTPYVEDMVYLNAAKYYAAISDGRGGYTRGERLTGVASTENNTWIDQIRAFIAANADHVRAASLTPSLVLYVHAMRFWAVKAGLVVTSKSNEFLVVENPSAQELQAVSDDEVAFIAEHMGQALTACAARVSSWRKTNHATGAGERGQATGFPRRWLVKEGLWEMGNDPKRTDDLNRQATTAFYIGTHAVSVHAALALMVPDDDHHWAVLNPRFGLLKSWDVRDSTKLRLTPRTQVAGSAMVTDSVVVVKMLISEGLSGMLSNVAALDRLATQYHTVEREGMRTAVYARWFFDGHHEGITKVDFNQKDPSTAALIGELAMVATKFYAGTTIADSPALKNAASQLASAADVTKWANLAKAKTGSVSQQALAVYGRLAGAAAGNTIENLASKDEAQVRAAVAEYGVMLDTHAAKFGVQVYAKPAVDQVIQAMPAADARAADIAALAV